MKEIDKTKKIVGIVLICGMILFNAIVIFREDIKLEKIQHELNEIRIETLYEF